MSIEVLQHFCDLFLRFGSAEHLKNTRIDIMAIHIIQRLWRPTEGGDVVQAQGVFQASITYTTMPTASIHAIVTSLMHWESATCATEGGLLKCSFQGNADLFERWLWGLCENGWKQRESVYFLPCFIEPLLRPRQVEESHQRHVLLKLFTELHGQSRKEGDKIRNAVFNGCPLQPRQTLEQTVFEVL